MLSPLKADTFRKEYEEGGHCISEPVLRLSQCDSHVLPSRPCSLHCQNKSAVILVVTRGVGEEWPFMVQVGFCDTGFSAALRGGVILTTAELSSTVKRRPDKDMSVFTPSNTASYLFLQKKKAQKILNNRKCPSFNTVKIFQCCQSDFRASPCLCAPSRAPCCSSGFGDVPLPDKEVIDFPRFVHIDLDEGSGLRESQPSLFVALVH